MSKGINALLLLMFTSANNVSKLLGIGEHAVRISALAETEASQKDAYQDRTPQLEVTFEGEKEKTFKAWLNLKGYMSFHKKAETDVEGLDCLSAEQRKSGKFIEAPDGYAVDVKTSKRIECKRKSESAQSIIAKLLADAGIPEGETVNVEELIGKPVGINVIANADGNLRFRYSMPVAQVGKAKKAKA
jgi:hypothetical protein